ncbi:alpha beta-hydrolase [Flammula alnicola]|nr:alpha beta-hydrolase [Flammula alnicola]
MVRRIALFLALQTVVQATPFIGSTVKLDSATVTGITDGLVTKFLGIPFAAPPGRFRAAQAPAPYRGNLNAKQYGPSCPQQKLTPPATGIAEISNVINTTPELHDASGVESEDCLTINIIKPTVTNPFNHGFPVLVWIHGGAYQIGDTVSYDDMGSNLVERSIALGQPIIFVSMNYRLSAYGFLAGLEIFQEGNGNLGLRDQRLALQWVNKYIHAFGGDGSKVTIWGQSSGAISVSLHMLTNGGNSEGLFRAGFMQSGAPLPIGNITKGTGQTFYDVLTADTGCSTSSDTLACLRALPFSILKAAVDNTPSFFSYQSLALVWHPSVDGVFLHDNPQSLVQQGNFAKVPFVAGTCDDEGTLFGLSSLNITTDDGFKQYVSSVWLPRNPASELEQLWTFYPSDITQGSPFGTSNANALTPQFKRISAFIGDSVQQGPRRAFLQQASAAGQKVWTYLSQKVKTTQGIGSYHGSDLATGVVNDYLINFVNHLDPNISSGVHWPQYTAESPQMYTFPVSGQPSVTLDTYRGAAVNYLNNLSLAHPFVL